MQTIHIDASTSYDVVIGNGLLSSVGERITQLGKASRVMIVSDDNVYPLYGSIVKENLEKEGFFLSEYIFPYGEKSKNLTTYGALLEKMCELKMTRSDIVVALGGGVVGDLAGFAAATYQRGIRFVQIPTTLLAAVDASVGGKTAVDLEGGKNQVGCFHQPSLVLCDVDTLTTLPADEYKCGCAEIIKYAMIKSASFFDVLRKIPVSEQLEEVIAECVKMKRDYVLEDEFDNGARMMLNFGHTFGHGVEQCSSYSVLHGMGVSIGMAVMTRAAVKKGYCDASVEEKLISILKQYGLPTTCDYSADDMISAILLDKKTTGSSLRLIVPKDIGTCIIEKIDTKDIKEWLVSGGIHG